MGTANKSDINGYLRACFLCACARVSLEYISRSQIAGSEGMQKFNLELSFKSGDSKKIYCDKKFIIGCQGPRVGRSNQLQRGNDYTGGYICQNSLTYILKIDAF